MARRGAISALAGALLFGGCTTTGGAGHAMRSVQAAAICFEVANRRLDPVAGQRVCDAAVADAALAPALRAATLVNRGVLRVRARAAAAALVDFDAAIALAPDNPDAYFNKGIALSQIRGRDAEAVTAFTAALDRNPARPEYVYFQRAGAYESLGRLRDAYEDYSEAAQLAPGWAEPANELQRFKVVRRRTLAG